VNAAQVHRGRLRAYRLRRHAALRFGHLPGGIVLLVATAGWAITALALYVAFWWR
jgi:hypothetical protein